MEKNLRRGTASSLDTNGEGVSLTPGSDGERDRQTDDNMMPTVHQSTKNCSLNKS